MAARYLLDTNIVSYLLKRQMPATLSRYTAAEPGSVVISSIAEAEVFYGVANRPGAARLRAAAEGFFASAAVVPWDSAAARVYGELRAAQERKGRPLSVEDMMIAAHALSLNLTLVTHDSVFSLVDGLRTEDWTVS